MTSNKSSTCIRCICNAYHQGFEIGYTQRTPKNNPYSNTTNEYIAWNYGYEIGYNSKASVLSTRNKARNSGHD